MNSGTAILLALVLLLGNAFFVAAEFALVSARRTQIEPRAEAGNRFARTTLRAMENMSEVIAVNQLGITVCSLVLGAVAEPTMAHLIEPVLDALHVPESFLHPIAFAIGLSIVVFLHVVMGEMIPKNIALAGPDRAALVLGTPVWAFVTVLRPVIRVINAVASRAPPAGRGEPDGRGQLDLHPRGGRRPGRGVPWRGPAPGRRVRPARRRARLHRAHRRGGADAARHADHRAPRRHRRRGRGRLRGHRLQPVPGDRRRRRRHDRWTLGYLHIKDVLEPDEERRHREIEPSWIRPFAPVRASDSLHEALEILQRRGSHMATVIDDDGRFLGLATLEDVIEELVGEIRDAAHLDE